MLLGLYFLVAIGFHFRIRQIPQPHQLQDPTHGVALPNAAQSFLDPTDPKQAVHRNLDQFITVGGVIYRPGVHYNCTKQNGNSITIPRLPTFIIVGVQKGGTSALNALLSKHRRIMKPAYFEPHFFDQHPAIIKQKTVQKVHALEGKEKLRLDDAAAVVKGGVHTYQTPPLVCDLRETYASSCFYKGQVMHYPAMLTYEKTPAYILTEGAPTTIKTIAPWTKIIVSLRNPVDRAFSNFKMMLSRAKNPSNKTFEDVLSKDLAALRHHGFSVPDNEPFPKVELDEKQLKNRRWKFQNYIYRSIYVDQLRPWLEKYKVGENLLIVRYERLNSHPDVVLRDILEFLQIPDHAFRYKEMVKSYSPTFWKTSAGSNATSAAGASAARKLTFRSETRAYLKRLFEPYNQQLAELLGESEWKDIWNGTERY